MAAGEGGEGMSGVDGAVDDVGIAAAGDVVESAAEGQVVSEKVEALFELQVEGEICGKALSAGCADEFLLVVKEAEGESGAGFEGVGDFEFVDDGEFEEGKISPGEKAVGSVPGIGAGLLRAEDGVVDVEIESLVGAGAGAGVGAHQHEAFAKVVAEADLEGAVVILTSVLEDVVSGGGVVGRVVDESVIAAALEEFGFQVDRRGEFLFEADAPVEEAREFQSVVVDGESCADGAGGGDAVGGAGGVGSGEESVLTRAGVGAGDQEDGRGVVDDADAGGEFGVSGIVEDIGSGEAGREDGVVDRYCPSRDGRRVR